jgi:hypothetical protein
LQSKGWAYLATDAVIKFKHSHAPNANDIVSQMCNSEQKEPDGTRGFWKIASSHAAYAQLQHCLEACEGNRWLQADPAYRVMRCRDLTALSNARFIKCVAELPPADDLGDLYKNPPA